MFTYKLLPFVVAIFGDELDRYGRKPSQLANQWAKQQLHHVINFDELELVSALQLIDPLTRVIKLIN